MLYCKVMNTADYGLPHSAKKNECSCKFKEEDHSFECPMFDSTEYPFKPGEIVLMDQDIARHFQGKYTEIRIVEEELEDSVRLKDKDGKIYEIAKDGRSARMTVEKEVTEEVGAADEDTKQQHYLKEPKKAKASAK